MRSDLEAGLSLSPTLDKEGKTLSSGVAPLSDSALCNSFHTILEFQHAVDSQSFAVGEWVTSLCYAF